MATVKFLIKGNQSPHTLYVRFRDGKNIDYMTSTTYTIQEKHWSKAKGKVKEKADFLEKKIVQGKLDDLEKKIFDRRNERIAKKQPINKEWFVNVVKESQGKPKDGVKDGLIETIGEYIEIAPHITNRSIKGKKGISQGTIRNYKTTIQRLKKFEAHKGNKYRLIEIDIVFSHDYIQFAANELGLSSNSIGKDIKNIKSVCSFAKDKYYLVNEQVFSKGFAAPSEPTIFTTLSEYELNQIFEFSGSNYLENARDWLIIGCWTGCRVGDLMNLSKKNLVTHSSGRQIIQYRQKKTDKLVNVPIHNHVEVILDKLDGFPRPISNEKFNKYIKEVCKKVGLTHDVEGTRQNPFTHKKESGTFQKWELVRSHTCRRSFATNHYNQMSNKQIMAVTGHTTEKMLLNYIGETESDHINDFLDLYDRKAKQTIPLNRKMG